MSKQLTTAEIVKKLRTAYGPIGRFEFCNDAADRLEAAEATIEYHINDKVRLNLASTKRFMEVTDMLEAAESELDVVMNQRNGHILERNKAEATIKAIEELLGSWRRTYYVAGHGDSNEAQQDCTDQVQAILDGKPAPRFNRQQAIIKGNNDGRS